MLSDPQTVTVNSVANTLNRIPAGADSGAFRDSAGLYKLTISHQYGKRVRHMVRFDYTTVVTDPLNASRSIPISMSTYLVVDVPVVGLTVATQNTIVNALCAYLTTSLIGKVLGGES